MSSRETLSTHLAGTGLEVGPGHVPFPVPRGVEVRFVDRLTSVQHHDLFPELPLEMGFVEPDIVADLDADRLRAVESSSQDFVIASHVIEHLADPLGFLDDAHRVLRVGGVLLLLVPDRRCTFDRDRSATPLVCLIRDHERDATVPDDDHVLDFLVGADQGPEFEIPDDPDARDRLFAWHRDRSIHVHCWTEDEFTEVLRYCSDDLGQNWECRARLSTAENGMEFGFVLVRTHHNQAGRFAHQLEIRDRPSWNRMRTLVGRARRQPRERSSPGSGGTSGAAAGPMAPMARR
jgi:SAM-dependent methyltransferase